MKPKDIKALHLKSAQDLASELENKRKQLLTLQLEEQVKKEKNSRRKRELRDDIALIATIMKEVQEKERHKS